MNRRKIILAAILSLTLISACSYTPVSVNVDIVDNEATVQHMFSDAQTETAIFQLAVSNELTKQAPTLTETPEYDLNNSAAMTPEPGDLSEEELQEIQSLLDQIKENPEDPFLRFVLAITYLEADRPQSAREAFQKAFQLSEENPQIILELGDRLSDLNIWTYAAYSYLLVDKLGSPIPPEELQDKIHEALYYAAFEDYSLEVLSNSTDIQVDPAKLRLIESRRALIMGQTDMAMRIVSNVLAEQHNLPEALLLKSDILIAQEDHDEAREILIELEQTNDLPNWIQEELGINTDY